MKSLLSDKVNKIRLTFFILLVIPMLFLANSCTNHRYVGTTQYFSFSFDYSKNDLIYPHSLRSWPFDVPAPPQLPFSKYPTALISIDFISDWSSNETDILSLDSALGSINGIIYHKIYEVNTVNLGDIVAEYVRYEYYSYDIKPISFSGIFVSALYKGELIEIDLVSSLGNKGAENAFQRIVDTFKIKEK
jgi:hypothetical protein